MLNAIKHLNKSLFTDCSPLLYSCELYPLVRFSCATLYTNKIDNLSESITNALIIMKYKIALPAVRFSINSLCASNTSKTHQEDFNQTSPSPEELISCGLFRPQRRIDQFFSTEKSN